MCDVYTERLPGRGAKRSTVTVWNCCYCGAGAMLCATTPACTSCGHQRCAGGGGWSVSTKVQSKRISIVPAESNSSSEPVSKVPDPQHRASPRPRDLTGGRLEVKEQLRSKVNVPEGSNPTAEPGSNVVGSAASGLVDWIKKYTGKGNLIAESIPPAEPISKVPDLLQQESPRPRDFMRDLLDAKDVLKNRGTLVGSTDTDIADAETVISSASSAVTLVDPGAVEAFARNVMRFQSLGCLWPQLVERCETKERCIHVIERLLKRYAKDLTLVSLEMQGSKMSDSQLCHAAARFVRKSRLQIARKIWEAQALNLDSSTKRDAMGRLSDIEVPNLEVEEDDDGPTDDYLMFEKIEEFLFDKCPIFSLQANIKLLVNISNSTDNGIVYRLSTSLNTSIRNAISFVYEPPLSPEHTRLRYTCKCGRRLYDDFKEIQSGALDKLEKLLGSYFRDYPVTLEPGDFEPSATPDSPNRNKTLGGLASLWNYLSGGRQKDARLPWTRQPTDDVRLGSCSTGTTSVRVDHNFVLLCLPFMKWTKKLHQIDTCNMQSDQAFFLSLRQHYAAVRKSRPWMSFRWFRRLHSLHFVKFEVYKQELVDIHDTPSVPDREGVAEAERNYSYDPLPAQTNPPIGSGLLMHLFQNPGHANTEPILYRKIPKKLRCRLEACPVRGSAVGWGVHFGEGVNGRALFAFGCIGFFCTLVFGVAWSKAHDDDIQSGFAIGGFMVTFLVFFLAMTRLEIQFEL